jgi:hypothetical protein
MGNGQGKLIRHSVQTSTRLPWNTLDLTRRGIMRTNQFWNRFRVKKVCPTAPRYTLSTHKVRPNSSARRASTGNQLTSGSLLAGLDTMHRPPTPFAVPTHDYPFSFMPTNSAQDFPPVILDMWTHDASVSLPSSSGGLDALLNTPRTSSKLWDHRQPDVALPDGGEANDGESLKPSPALDRPTGASRTSKRPPAKLVPYSASTISPNNNDMTLPTSSPLRIRFPSARLPTISPVTALTDGQSSTVPPKKARLAAERGRRGDLREKFAKLRDKLPMGGQKGSKVNVLDRGKRLQALCITLNCD